MHLFQPPVATSPREIEEGGLASSGEVGGEADAEDARVGVEMLDEIEEGGMTSSRGGVTPVEEVIEEVAVDEVRNV